MEEDYLNFYFLHLQLFLYFLGFCWLPGLLLPDFELWQTYKFSVAKADPWSNSASDIYKQLGRFKLINDFKPLRVNSPFEAIKGWSIDTVKHNAYFNWTLKGLKFLCKISNCSLKILSNRNTLMLISGFTFFWSCPSVEMHFALSLSTFIHMCICNWNMHFTNQHLTLLAVIHSFAIVSIIFYFIF